ncbi:MAG: bacillithiol biosynthesis cysteine-adding enzyme BshC [Candidatus Methylomirabilales bacterium]
MHLDLRRLPGTPPLLRDYAHAYPRVAPFFARDPHPADAYAEAARALAARRYPRAEVAAALRARHAAWGAPAPVHERIQELAHPESLAVVTGQQTGLFGGPLFTLYKALTAVRLAEQARQALGRPVVPLFWLAAEDHDVAEADHVTLLDRTGGLLTVRHSAWGSPGYMPAQLLLGPAVHETLEAALGVLPSSDFLPAVAAALREAYAPERTLAEAFARWMLGLLGRFGLVLVDGADPALKRLAAPVFQQEAAEAPRSSQRILEASRALRALGYPNQIEARPDGVNCFLLRDGRRPLARDGADLRLRDGGERLAAAELQRIAREEPERLSPNVALRPIVQDALFPTLAYVAGPGELSYFAQLRPVYEAFGVPMPLILPRASFTLLEPRPAQLLEKFRLALPDLVREPEQLASQVLRAQLPPDLDATLARARAGVDELFREVGEAVAAVDPTLRATVGQSAGHIKGHLDQLQKKAVQALKRREEETRTQVQRLRQALMPGGRPQERVLPALPYLARHGTVLLDAVHAAIHGPGWTHQLLRLGG